LAFFRHGLAFFSRDDGEPLIEQQNRYLRDDLLKLKEIAEGDTEAWKKLNYNERCAICRERDKTKLIFKKSSGGFATNSLNTSTVKDAGKMLEILNATGNALDFAICKMCWLKLIK